MAQKKKEKNLKRSNIITLKLTDIELAVLNEAADVTGLSRSEYLRKLLLEKQINHAPLQVHIIKRLLSFHASLHHVLFLSFVSQDIH